MVTAVTGNFVTATAPNDKSVLATVPALEQSATDIARLRALLDSAPESQQPALRDALAAAERTYEALVAYLANK